MVNIQNDEALDTQAEKALELVDEISSALGPSRSERFLMKNADLADRYGIGDERYWQWIYEQHIRYVLGVRGHKIAQPHMLHTGSTSKPGSHASNRHK